MEDRIYDVLDEPSADVHRGEINAYEGVIEYLRELGYCHVDSEALIAKLWGEVSLSQALQEQATGPNPYQRGMIFALGMVLNYINQTGIGGGEDMHKLVIEINRNLTNYGVK